MQINQWHLLAPIADVLGREGRKEGRKAKKKTGRGFQH